MNSGSIRRQVARERAAQAPSDSLPRQVIGASNQCLGAMQEAYWEERPHSQLTPHSAMPWFWWPEGYRWGQLIDRN